MAVKTRSVGRPPKVTNTQIARACSKKGKKGAKTRKQLAEMFGVHPLTMQIHLNKMREQGQVEIVGKVETGRRGRPSFKFQAR
jgi:predicted ArsR family transcriptional regulator